MRATYLFSSLAILAFLTIRSMAVEPEIAAIRALGGRVYSEDVRAKESLSTIYSVSFPTKPVEDYHLKNLASFPNLRILHLSGTKNVTDAGLWHISKLNHLELLCLAETAVTDQGMYIVQRFPQMRKLFLISTQITDDGVQKLSGLLELEELDLTSTNVSDPGLRVALNFPKLRKLTLTGTKVTDNGLSALGSVPNLTVLYIGHTGVTAQGLAALKDCKQLSVVGAVGIQPADDILTSLKGMESLETLWVSELSDSGLQGIADLKGLKTLVVCDSKLTDSRLKSLKVEYPRLRVSIYSHYVQD